MTRFDLHPEDLLDRAGRGSASAAELARLAQHLAECDVCRVERGLTLQAARDGAPLRDEALVVARLKRDVTARAAAPGRRTKRKGAFALVAFAAVSAASVAAAATFVIVRRVAEPQVVAPPPPAAAKSAPAPAAAPVKQAEPNVVVEETPAEPDEARAAPDVVRKAAPPAVEPSSASELFSRANQARRDGKVTEAVRLYRALQERFSGTSEELVSRVTLGRLLLDRLGDSRGALVQFNSYLASPGGGALREEAMVGRALALGRMGRAAEERAAWQALLDGFPKSTQRKRAEARLVELGGGVPGGGVRDGSGAGRAERTR